jgi:hypothetical protein
MKRIKQQNNIFVTLPSGIAKFVSIKGFTFEQFKADKDWENNLVDMGDYYRYMPDAEEF